MKVWQTFFQNWYNITNIFRKWAFIWWKYKKGFQIDADRSQSNRWLLKSANQRLKIILKTCIRLQAYRKAEEYFGIQRYLKRNGLVNKDVVLLKNNKWVVQKLLRPNARFRIYGTIELKNKKLGVITGPEVKNSLGHGGWHVREVKLKVWLILNSLLET